MEGLLEVEDDCYLAECNLGDLKKPWGYQRLVGYKPSKPHRKQADLKEYGYKQQQQDRTQHKEGTT